MSNDEQYNGWANRETWAFNLHWQNEEGLYRMVQEWVSHAMAAARHDDPDATKNFLVGDYVIREAQDLWAEASGDRDQPLAMWERETGSVWRVDRSEVGSAAREAFADNDVEV